MYLQCISVIQLGLSLQFYFYAHVHWEVKASVLELYQSALVEVVNELVLMWLLKKKKSTICSTGGEEKELSFPLQFG